jgi:hypothetical protein
VALSIGVRDVKAKGGRIYVDWTDGTQSEFSSVANAKAFGEQLELSDEQLKQLVVALFFRRSPTGANRSIVIGKTLTLDLSADPMLVISNG